MQKRASEAVELKGVWWNQRKAAAEEAISTAPAATPFAALPLPKWQLGKPVSLEDLKKVRAAASWGCGSCCLQPPCVPWHVGRRSISMVLLPCPPPPLAVPSSPCRRACMRVRVLF
jgi:hypothetical protein